MDHKSSGTIIAEVSTHFDMVVPCSAAT